MKKKKRRNKKIETPNRKDIQNTDKWMRAEWMYMELVTSGIMPFNREVLSQEEKIDFLKSILKVCPEYYPALIETGYKSIQEGKDDIGKKFIDKGLESLKKNFSDKELIEAYYQACDFLEKHFRFNLAIEYYERLMEVEKDKASVFDSLACCYVHLGEMDKALELQYKALELEPGNCKYHSNFGWIEMIRGNLSSAKEMLEKALELDKEDKYAINNYEICKTIISNEKMKNWEGYLLRERDEEYFEELEEEEDLDEYDNEVQRYNLSRLEAFELHFLKNSNYTYSEKYDIVLSLKYVFGIISSTFRNDYFFYEDIEFVMEYFRPVMHNVIFKTKDIDEKIFNSIYKALMEFYKFLEEKQVLCGYEKLEEEMLKWREELMGKIIEYNNIRHNEEYGEKDKYEICEKLFEGDIFNSPF